MAREAVELSSGTKHTPEAGLLANEAALLLGGAGKVPEAIKEHAVYAWNHKLATLGEATLAFAAGAALAYCSKNPEALFGAARVISKSATPLLVATTAGDALARVGAPMVQVARDPSSLENEKLALGNNLGSMVVDYTIAGAAGYAGSKLGGPVLNEIHWRNTSEPLKVESQIAARAATNDLRWVQKRLPDSANTEQLGRFEEGLKDHIQDQFGLHRGESAWMAREWQRQTPIPPRLTEAQLGTFEQTLAEEVSNGARFQRDDYMSQTGRGTQIFDYLSNKLGGRPSVDYYRRVPHIDLGDHFTTSIAERSGINEKDFKNLVTWRSGLGGGVPTIDLEPGRVSTSNLSDRYDFIRERNLRSIMFGSAKNALEPAPQA